MFYEPISCEAYQILGVICAIEKCGLKRFQLNFLPKDENFEHFSLISDDQQKLLIDIMV